MLPGSGCALALLLAATGAGGVENRGQQAEPQVAMMVTQRTNAFRVASGLAALSVNRPLADAAQRFAEYMASTDQYGHEADGRAPAERARAQGYEYCVVAENIAYQFSSAGFAPEELAGQFVDGWEKSPGHRHNLLLPQVVDTGIGVARSARTQRYYAVQMFGLPKSAALRFEIVNRSDIPIRYELETQAYTLPPRVTRTHEGCLSGALKVLWPDAPAGTTLQPRDGARYAVQRDQAGQLRLQTN